MKMLCSLDAVHTVGMRPRNLHVLLTGDSVKQADGFLLAGCHQDGAKEETREMEMRLIIPSEFNCNLNTEHHLTIHYTSDDIDPSH